MKDITLDDMENMFENAKKNKSVPYHAFLLREPSSTISNAEASIYDAPFKDFRTLDRDHQSEKVVKA